VSFRKVIGIILLVWLALWGIVKMAPRGTSIRQGIAEVFYFPLKAFHASVESTNDFFRTHTSLVRENKFLKEELTKLSFALTRADEIQRENEHLKKLLGIKQTAPRYVTTATVVARDSVSFFRTILVDKGIQDGITNATFIATDKGLVGRIVEPYDASSRVMLITDPDSRVTGIVSTTRDQGIIYGTGRHFLIMKYLPPQNAVAKGATVITSGLGGVYPKGFMVGVVARVQKDPTGLYAYAIIIPSAELNKLEEVLCLK